MLNCKSDYCGFLQIMPRFFVQQALGQTLYKQPCICYTKNTEHLPYCERRRPYENCIQQQHSDRLSGRQD